MVTLDILHCDNHVLAVNKPGGLVTQPSGRHADSMESRARGWVKERFHKPGRVFLEAVHRIDRPVSGIVLFARTSKALSRLQRAIREGRVEKRYLALVEGRPPKAEGRLRHWLIHASHRARVVAAGTPGAREAVLEYRVLGEVSGNALLAITLHTGRYHQIRVQLQALGCPVWGDRRYGGCRAPAGEGIGLHHWRLRVPHPVGDQRLSVTAPPPDIPPWREAMRTLGSRLDTD